MLTSLARLAVLLPESLIGVITLEASYRSLMFYNELTACRDVIVSSLRFPPTCGLASGAISDLASEACCFGVGRAAVVELCSG